jgi:hypothetical protein
MLGLASKPLVVDSTTYESHHVSRHDERRRNQTHKGTQVKDAGKDTGKDANKGRGGSRTRSKTVRSLPKLAVAASAHSHLVLAAWTGTGIELTRRDMGLRSLVTPKTGRPPTDGGPPGGRWRRHMERLLNTHESRRRCGYTQRWQVETVNSMMKRNLGSALGGKSAWSRRRDMLLKVLTHNLMVLKRRVETEQVGSSFSKAVRVSERSHRYHAVQ